MSESDIDEYLGTLDEPKRTTLGQLRNAIVAIVPDAEQGISYGFPAFRLGGKTIAGFAAFKSHLSYLPHSGSVISRLAEETEGYTKDQGFTPLSRRRAAARGTRKEIVRRPDG